MHGAVWPGSLSAADSCPSPATASILLQHRLFAPNALQPFFCSTKHLPSIHESCLQRFTSSMLIHGMLQVLVDVNWRPVFWPDQSTAPGIIRDFCKRADILKLSDEEAELLYDIPRKEALKQADKVLWSASIRCFILGPMITIGLRYPVTNLCVYVYSSNYPHCSHLIMVVGKQLLCRANCCTSLSRVTIGHAVDLHWGCLQIPSFWVLSSACASPHACQPDFIGRW